MDALAGLFAESRRSKPFSEPLASGDNLEHICLMSRPPLDISAMTPDEKLDLIGELWDSLDGNPPDLSPEQRTELQRRMAEVEAHGPSGVPWSEVEAKLLDRIG